MPYARRNPKSARFRKPYKKRSYTRKPSAKSMYSIAKRVLRSNTETKKSQVDDYGLSTGQALYHNVPNLITTQLLQTSQSYDGDGAIGSRIGLESYKVLYRTRILAPLQSMITRCSGRCIPLSGTQPR
eukprot:3799040-Pyramimonas_sp.AAC.1